VLFEQALAEFPDGSIDLLHIDGTHTYDAVKADFQSWLPKLSSRSIVLFHDVILRDRGFGVWKLWEEIRGEDRSFVFEFGYGLGVWKKEVVTTEDAPFIQKLFRATETEKRDINNFYVTAATALALWQDSQKLQVFDEKVGHVGLLRRETGQRADLPLDVERELAESSKHVAAPQREDEERTRQVREKESELVDLRHEHETQNSSIAELNRTIADQSRKVADLQQRIETNLAEADQLRGEITKQRARHERDNLRRSRLAQQLRARLQEAEERAARARADLSNAEWEVLSLRGSSIRDAESANSLSRIQEIESRAEVAESDRAHLREMVVALQQDLAQERVSRDAAQNDLRTAQDKLAVAHKDLAAARKELRRQQNPLDWVRRAFGGKLVLQFGRSQQRLKELTTATPSDD
jgi:predicted  nucleic acid-binding Zn-ribbon protein